MDVAVSGTIDQKTYLKKYRGASAPLAPPWIRLRNVSQTPCRENSHKCLNAIFQTEFDNLYVLWRVMHIMPGGSCPDGCYPDTVGSVTQQ